MTAFGQGYAAAPLSLRITYPGAPPHLSVVTHMTHGEAMQTYSMRQFEALINGRTIAMHGLQIQKVPA
jgi:hypothetical protein